MISLKCPECPKEFSKATKEKAELALKMHASRKHKKEGALVEQRVKRKWTRRQVPTEVKFNFCPECGTDLHRLAMGIALAERLKGKVLR